MIIGIIVLYQLFIAGIGPTPYPYLENTTEGGENNTPTLSQYPDDNSDLDTNPDNPNYDVNALNAYNNTRNLAWASIGLMALGVIVIAAVTILGFVKAGIGGGRV